MKRIAIALALCLVAWGSQAASVWPDTSGGGGSALLVTDSSPQLGGDLDIQTFNITMPTIEYNAGATALLTGDQVAFWERPVKVGAIFQCNTASDNTTDSCNDDTDCPNGACVRNDGTDGTDGMFETTICMGATAFGPDVNDPLGGAGAHHQDNMWTLAFNAGPNCAEGTVPQVAGAPFVRYNKEFDWRVYTDDPANALVEEYRIVIPEGGNTTNDDWRDYFFGANLNPANRTAVHSFSFGSYKGLETTTAIALGGFKNGQFGNIYNPGTRSSIDNNAPSGHWQWEGGSNWGGDDPGGWIDTNEGHYSQGMQSTLHTTNASDSVQTALYNKAIQDGANFFGACDANSTSLGEGEQCVTNKDCNGGTAYDSGIPNGICVKGNGANSDGTADGLCIHSSTGVVATTGTIFCDVLGVQDVCTASETCTDIQDRYHYSVALLEGSRMEARTSAASSNVATWGWCSSDAGGSPESEGIQCFSNEGCGEGSGVCVFDNDGDRYTGRLVGQSIIVAIDDSRTNNTPGHIGNLQEVSGVAGLSMEYIQGGNNQNINESSMIEFRAPVITGTGGNHFNESLIKALDQWGPNANYTPSILKTDAFTGKNSGIFYGFNLGSWGWDTGNWRLGDIRMWNGGEGTSPQSLDLIRVEQASDPTSSGDGYVLMQSTNSDSYGAMWWGDIGDASFDTGNKVCVARGMQCVTSFEIGVGTEVACGSVAVGTASGFFSVACK